MPFYVHQSVRQGSSSTWHLQEQDHACIVSGELFLPRPHSSSCTEEQLIHTLQIFTERRWFVKSQKGKNLQLALSHYFLLTGTWLEKRLHVVSCNLRRKWTISSSVSSSIKLSFWCRDAVQAAMMKAVLTYWQTSSKNEMQQDEGRGKSQLFNRHSGASPSIIWKNIYKM